MIVCTRVSKDRNGCTVLSDVTMQIEPRECVCILGKARSGKTTLFELLLKLEEPTAGSIDVDGVQLKALPPLVLQLYRSKLGIIFQEPRLLDHLTVAENIAFPLELRGTSDATVVRRMKELLKRLNLTALSSAMPAELSRSERALVGIARAFVTGPLILIADEPLLGLDAAQSQVVLDLFREAKDQGCTIVAFASDPVFADELDARVLILEKGKIKEEIKKETIPAIETHRVFETVPTLSVPVSAPRERPAPGKRPHREKKSVKITAINS